MEQKDYERITTIETQLAALSKGDAYSAIFLTRNEAELRFRQIYTD